jgi:CubicO group peptidase (beta-lactamase class C family)
MLRYILIVSIIISAKASFAQSTTAAFADSIRRAYKIPELSYAVVSSDSILELHALGLRKVNTRLRASLNDRFRIGSNTKAITGFIAAQQVKEHKLSWDTKFFDLFPEMAAGACKEYLHLTLLDLLSFRTKLFPYTYTNAKPVKSDFSGNEEQQRYQFAKWMFTQPPVRRTDSVCFSNLGYVAAGLMLEKASGKPYKQLVAELGSQLGIDFGFGQPNDKDPLQTWGHNASLQPEAPGDNYKLSWLLAAGNVNATLPGYAKFIQLQLKGIRGQSPILTKEEFDFLHYGLTQFAVGWFWDKDEKGRRYSWHIGNPGTFFTKVYVFKDCNRAFLLFANAQTDQVDEGMTVLYNELKRRYCK